MLATLLASSLAASPATGADEAVRPQTASPSEGPTTEDELERQAQVAFSAGDYERVVELAAQAHAVTGALRHLYAQAHAQRFAGDCQAALALYARVLAAEPDGPFGTLSRDGIRLCESQLATQTPAPAPTPAPPPAEPSEPEPEPAQDVGDSQPDREERDRWIEDPLGGVLLGVGVAGLAVGAGLSIAAGSVSRAAESADNETFYAGDRQRSRRLIAGGAVSFAVGGVLIVGAAARYAVVARRLRLAAAIGSDGAWMAVTGRF